MEHSRWRVEWNLPYFKKYPADFIDEPRTEETDSAVTASNRWEPAPLESEADRGGDVRSLKRRLDQRVFMLVRRKGGSGSWEFPSVEHEEVSVGAESGHSIASGSQCRQLLGGWMPTLLPFLRFLLHFFFRSEATACGDDLGQNTIAVQSDLRDSARVAITITLPHLSTAVAPVSPARLDLICVHVAGIGS